jgi:predicted MFS family arabinose efflux permease
MSGRRGAVALLSLLRRNADYRRLFVATVVSFMGDWFAFVAVSGFVTESTGRGGLAAVVYAASVLPVFALSPVAGVVADRVDRRRLLVAVDLLRIVPALAMVPAMWWNAPWLIIACVAVLAALSAFFEPISAAVVPNVVEPGDLSLAQAALGSVWGTMLFVGAGVGGIVSALLGREASFVLDALTFLVAAMLVARIRRPLQEARLQTGASFWSHLGEVWAFARQSFSTRALLVTKGGVGLANGIVGLLPAFAHARFSSGDEGVGVLLASRGAGALIGPFVAHVFVRGDLRRLFIVCGGATISYGVAYAFLPLTSTLLLAAGCVVLAHLGGGAQWVLSTYGLQTSTPDGIRGRVLSIDFGLATLAIGLSSLFAAGAAEATSIETASWTLSLVAVAYGVIWLWWTRPLWRRTARARVGISAR